MPSGGASDSPSGASDGLRVTIRPIGVGEREALYEMAQRFWEELMPHAPVVQDPSIRQRYFEYEFHARDSRVGQPGHPAWWAIVEGERAGFATARLSRAELDEDWTGRPWAYIKDFYVEPRWRRLGVGRAFVQALLDWLDAQGVYRVDLHARSDAPAARAFWEAVGFDLASYRMRRYLG
jgi:GNAT superfamily N-acetyltransferase